MLTRAPDKDPLPLAALLLCSYRTTVRVWDIAAVLNGNGPPVVKSVWSVDDLPPGPSGSNSEGLMTVRYTGKASGLVMSAGLGLWALMAWRLMSACGIHRAAC
jgi:hypothetical protein